MLRRTVIVLLTALSWSSCCFASEPLFSTVVSFQNCVETIGVGLVPTVSVLPDIPANIIPVGIDQPVTPIVVRTAKSDISIHGWLQRQKIVVQVGLVIVPPDGTGDINNYTLYYYTDDIRLALLLNLTGVCAQYVPNLSHAISNNGVAKILVPFPASPRLTIQGNVFPSQVPAGSFVANWWQRGYLGTVKMQTNVPVIKIGGADLRLTTPSTSALANIVGSSELTFPLVQQFNLFTNAAMTITVD